MLSLLFGGHQGLSPLGPIPLLEYIRAHDSD